MSFLFDVASVLMIASGCGYILLAGVAFFSYKQSGSKALLIFLGAFITLFFMNLYGGVAGAYHPFDGNLLGYLFGGFTFNVLSTNITVTLLADITVKNMFVFETTGVIAIILFMIALYKA
nr:hypothetical protein [Candidatus Freyarchaeota archaeon]